MKEASLNKRHTYPAASALLRTLTVALLILAPVVLASAQSSGPPSDSASAGRSRAEDGATRISSDSESDPISLEALQEGIKNFELRRMRRMVSRRMPPVQRRKLNVAPAAPASLTKKLRMKGPPRRAQAAPRCSSTSGCQGDDGPHGGRLAGRSLRRRLARNHQPSIPRAAS